MATPDAELIEVLSIAQHLMFILDVYNKFM